MPETARLTSLARHLLPPGTAVAAADPRILYPLFPGEALPRAVPARLAEFSAGRHAARMALGALGLAPQPIPMADDRAPIWPVGVSGCITHSRSQCLAALRRGDGGLGLDIEEDADLPVDLWPTVLSDDERAWVEAQPFPGRAARLVFSAKEAVYKAQYGQSRTLFGFDMLELAFEDKGFVATFRDAVPPFAAGHRATGRWGQSDLHILTVAVI